MLNNTNKAKKTCYKFFAYMGLYGVPRARTRERNNDLFTLVLEREYTIIWNYQIISHLFSVSFS